MSPPTLPQLQPLELLEPAHKDMVAFLMQNGAFIDAVMGSAQKAASTRENIMDMYSKGCWRRIPYKFVHKARIGRLYALNRPSLQGMKKIRHLTLRGIARDWGTKNCHPTLLAQLCRRHNIDCHLLDEYIASRQAKLELISGTTVNMRTGEPLTLGEAEDCFLALLNGGGGLGQSALRVHDDVDGQRAPLADISDPWVIAFYKEMQRIGAGIAALYTAHAAAAGKNDGV